MDKLEVVFSEKSVSDLKEIAEYIQPGNAERASSFIHEIIDFCKQELAMNPRIGRGRDDLNQNLRSFPFRKYVIFYRYHIHHLEIIHVIHSARDIRQIYK